MGLKGRSSVVDDGSDLAQAWAKVLEKLGSDPRIESMDKKWLQRARPIGLMAHTALLAAPNEYAKGVLEGRLIVPITEVLAAHFGRQVIIAVLVDPSQAGDTGTPADTPAAEVRAAPAREDREDTGTTAGRAADEAETVLRKLTPARLTQLRKDDPRTADKLAVLLFRTAMLAARAADG